MERDEPIPAVDEYVEHLAFTAALDDGTRVRIRPIAPKDRERILAGWKYLSARTRYLRFLQAKPRLTDRDLTYLTEIDYGNHFAWAAESLDDQGHPGIGIARYVRVADDPTVAEAAVTVVDDRQHLGLGRILLGALAEAAHANGITRFRVYVSPENRQVIDSLARIGTASRADDGLVRIEFPVPESLMDDSPLYSALRTVAAIEHGADRDEPPS